MTDGTAGQKCRVCSMPFAAGLAACPSCAYDRQAASKAEAVPEDQAPDPRRRWKVRRQV